jgi:hypothetical protein
MTLHQFCYEVGDIVQREYGIDDGADLCYNLVEMGVIEMQAGFSHAAHVVAQHIEQA